MYQTRKLALAPGHKMAEVILNNPYLLLLLEHFGISVPLKDKTIEQICRQYNINIELFLTFASLYNGVVYEPKTAFKSADSLTIISYLKNNHSYYQEEIYPAILATIRQMAGLNESGENGLVEQFFVEYFNEVREHLEYENEVVFPYVINLSGKVGTATTSNIQAHYSVGEYKEHHNDIQEKLNDLKNLLIKYLPRQNDLPLRRKLLFMLSELEYDLDIHSRIEDRILIPLVAEMETHLKTTE